MDESVYSTHDGPPQDDHRAPLSASEGPSPTKTLASPDSPHTLAEGDWVFLRGQRPYQVLALSDLGVYYGTRHHGLCDKVYYARYYELRFKGAVGAGARST